MLNYITGHYAYWFVFILLILGLYGMMMKKNLVKKLIGMTIFQVAVIIFYVACAVKWGGTVPILKAPHEAHADHNGHAVVQTIDTAEYINPLPHTLMLTAIVVGVATTGVAFALVIGIFRRYRTLEEPELLELMKKDEEDS